MEGLYVFGGVIVLLLFLFIATIVYTAVSAKKKEGQYKFELGDEAHTYLTNNYSPHANGVIIHQGIRSMFFRWIPVEEEFIVPKRIEKLPRRRKNK